MANNYQQQQHPVVVERPTTCFSQMQATTRSNGCISIILILISIPISFITGGFLAATLNLDSQNSQAFPVAGQFLIWVAGLTFMAFILALQPVGCWRWTHGIVSGLSFGLCFLIVSAASAFGGGAGG
jgi:hypothetical protein